MSDPGRISGDEGADERVIPAHESPLRRLMADAHGEPYDAVRSLEEASARGAVVVMEGDYGGSIYLTCPAEHVGCDEATLEQLLLDLDQMYWGDPDGARLYFERAATGARIAGGTGGGVVTDTVWIHPELEAQGEGVREAVEAVVSGRRASLSLRPHVVVEELTPDARERIVDGRRLLRGRTLASWLRQFGGYEGRLRHPATFERFTVSLEPWRERDPDSTWLDVFFIIADAEPADGPHPSLPRAPAGE